MKIKYIFLAILMILTSAVFAQNPADVEMADTFRSEGKIYVVLAVVLTILAGIFIYLIRIDRKLTKLEKE